VSLLLAFYLFLHCLSLLKYSVRQKVALVEQALGLKQVALVLLVRVPQQEQQR
jgi:hypothetical protein